MIIILVLLNHLITTCEQNEYIRNIVYTVFKFNQVSASLQVLSSRKLEPASSVAFHFLSVFLFHCCFSTST